MIVNNIIQFYMDNGFYDIGIENEFWKLTVLHGEVLDVVTLVENNAEEDEEEGHPKTICKVTREVKAFYKVLVSYYFHVYCI